MKIKTLFSFTFLLITFWGKPFCNFFDEFESQHIILFFIPLGIKKQLFLHFLALFVKFEAKKKHAQKCLRKGKSPFL